MTYTLTFPPGVMLINANGRSSKYAVSASSRFAKAKVTKSLREQACKMAKKQKIPHMDRIKVIAVYYPPSNARRDSSNVLFFSVKACLDGIVDSGCLKDDNDKVVRSTEYIPGDHVVAGGQMVIIIEAVDE